MSNVNVSYNGETMKTKRDLINAIFKQAGINFEGTEDFFRVFNELK